MGSGPAASSAPHKGLVAKNVLEAIDQGVALFDEADRLIFANSGYKQIFAGIVDIIEPGVTFEALIRLAAQRGQNVDSHGRSEAWVQERLAKHRAAAGVYEHRFADGRWIQVRERRTARGQIVGTYTDVTPLVERSTQLAAARDQLAALSRRMKAMIEASSDWIWSSDASGQVSCEPQSLRLDDGFDPAPHIAAALTTMAGDAGRPGARAVAAGRRFIHPVKCDDGRTLFLGISGKALYSENGAFEGYVGTASDETEKTHMQRDAAQRTAVLEGVLGSMQTGVILIAPDARIVMSNQQAQSLLGLSLVPGAPLAQLQPCLGDALFERIVLWSATERGPSMEEAEIVSADCASLVVRGNFMSSGGVVITVTDVTEQRRVATQNYQAQKLIALGELTGGVAHEFNNLLTSINGFAQLARQYAQQPEMVEECLAEVIGAADRAAQLTRQMLTFSRKERREEKTVVAAEIVRSLARLVKPLLSSTIQLALVIEDDRSCVKVDVAQLSLALMNLVLNARDSMACGGTVSLRVHSGADPADPADAEGSPRLCFSVSDQGTGIDQATLLRIFDPFFTTKEQGKGTGLGLSVVHGVVQSSGGTITVDSTVGRGTTFSIRLPVAAGAPERPEPVPPPAAIGCGQTIVVVENEPGVRRLVQRTLTAQGYRVLAAANHAALEPLLVAETAAPAMLVSGVVLPGKSGPEIAADLRQRFSAIQVLFMSGYVAPGIESLGLLGSDATVLAKPFAPEDLSRAVAQGLGEGGTAGALELTGLPSCRALMEHAP